MTCRVSFHCCGMTTLAVVSLLLKDKERASYMYAAHLQPCSTSSSNQYQLQDLFRPFKLPEHYQTLLQPLSRSCLTTMCIIEVGWYSLCTFCESSLWHKEYETQLTSCDGDCTRSYYRWNFYNIDPLSFDDTEGPLLIRDCRILCNDCFDYGEGRGLPRYELCKKNEDDRPPVNEYGPGWSHLEFYDNNIARPHIQ